MALINSELVKSFQLLFIVSIVNALKLIDPFYYLCTPELTFHYDSFVIGSVWLNYCKACIREST